MSASQIRNKQKKSANWFRDSLAAQFKNRNKDENKSRRKLNAALNSNSTTSNPEFKRATRKVKIIEQGRLYGYLYDPKYKKTLPYYDKFPLTLVLGLYSDGFLGLNMHYLPYPLRAKLLENVMESTKKTRRRGKEEEIADVSYRILKSSTVSRLMQFSIKRYLYGHVKSPFVEFMMPGAFESAVFLPTETFEKASKYDVWRDIRR